MALPRKEDNEFEFPILLYHIHVAFPGHNPTHVKAGLAFRKTLKQRFPDVYQTDVASPGLALFPVPQFALWTNKKAQFAEIVSFVTMNSPKGVSALVHPYLDRHPGDGGFRAMCVREHLDLGFWIGPAYALDADCNGCFDLMDDKTANHDDLSKTIMKTNAGRVAEAEKLLKEGWSAYRM